jgi:ketosteroid isomerase-like protein
MKIIVVAVAALVSVALSGAKPVASGAADDRAIVAALDSAYQFAVKMNDAQTMDRILTDDFILVTGNGTVYTKADLLKSARDRSSVYEHQESTQQTVRLYGESTAVVTALLWIKGTGHGQTFDFKVWYSDTYVKTPGGWRYAFGQAGAHLP